MNTNDADKIMPNALPAPKPFAIFKAFIEIINDQIESGTITPRYDTRPKCWNSGSASSIVVSDVVAERAKNIADNMMPPITTGRVACDITAKIFLKLPIPPSFFPIMKIIAINAMPPKRPRIELVIQ